MRFRMDQGLTLPQDIFFKYLLSIFSFPQNIFLKTKQKKAFWGGLVNVYKIQGEN